jgi:hypothetical protein
LDCPNGKSLSRRFLVTTTVSGSTWRSPQEGSAVGADGITLWRSTKQTDHRKAIDVARNWEKAARMAASSELTQAASIKLLDELMETTIGENLNVRSVEAYFAEWLKRRSFSTK